MEWLIISLLIIAGVIVYAGYYVFKMVFDPKMKLPFSKDDIDDPNNIMAPTARLHEEYRLKHLEDFKNLPFETLTIKSFDDLTLYGRFLKEKNSSETAILVHGYKSVPEHDFGGIVKVYLKRKCNILALENRAHNRSGGKYIGFSELDQYDIISWIKKVNEICPNSSIFLHGVSMGAATVMHTCNKEMKNVKGIIEDCGFTSIRDITKAMMKRTFNMPYFPVGYISGFFSKLLAKVDYDKSNGIKEAKESKYPILFISGSEDNYVPLQMTLDMYKACTSEKHLLIVENAGHVAANVVDEKEYFKQIEVFMDKYN